MTDDQRPISWRSIVILRRGRPVSAKEQEKVLRLWRGKGQLPDGYTAEPTPWHAIDFMGFETTDD